MYTERNQDMDKKLLDFSSVVWFNFGKGGNEVAGELSSLNILLKFGRIHNTCSAREKPQHEHKTSTSISPLCNT